MHVWVRPPGASPAGVVERDCPVPHLPAWLRTLIMKSRSQMSLESAGESRTNSADLTLAAAPLNSCEYFS